MFNDEERAYLREAEIIKAVSIEGIAPHSYIDSNGNIKGIAISVLDEIANLSGLTFEYALYYTMEEALSSNADIYFNVSKAYLLPGYVLSEPYMESETILFYNSELDPTKLEGRRFAAINGVTLPNGIKEEDVIYFKNREETFLAVDKGVADYGYGNAYSLAFYTLQNGYKNLTTIPQGKEDRAYCIALKESDEILLSIINKSLDAIDDLHLQTLILDVASSVERKINFSLMMEEYGCIILIMGLMVLLMLSGGVYFYMKANKRLENDIETIKGKEEEIRSLSYRDSLTKVYNRAFYDKEIKRIQNSGKLPYSIIMGDVNGLKFTNDIFGHKVGDKLLQRVADILKKSCRGDDSVIRYGGDEFIVLLPETSYEETKMIVERIRERYKSRSNNLIPSSISLGFSTKESLSSNINIFQEAENMMYQNKLMESAELKKEIINYLEDLLYEKDIKTEDYRKRLIENTKLLGKALKLSETEIEDLELLARFRDIGKAVDEKTGKEATCHLATGYRIATSSEALSQIAEHILSHHESWDGQGIPRGLKGEEIPLLARILTLAESYGELIDLNKEERIKALQDMKGKQLDPSLVDLFVSQI